ncbi:DinB family protein [Flagellimonas hymeniacidonis]|uniref:DinB family protein n=1 Tax=Flagellimonas hymeniacidonis TaxID=2603628 RepID=A0A5C8V5I3_9FLAO|nr:DinB family protein [Flagellimonas hymeniacidonis]TXN37304.1 DinB family protein [Flagellimonas hymeniacidonis]
MKKVIVLILSLALLSFSTSETELKKAERDFAIKELTKSRDSFLKELKGLSQKQLIYKSSESSWSIADCTEHIAIFENEVFEILEESLALPANPEMRKGVRFSDEKILEIATDRTKKRTTQEEFLPKGKYGDFDSTLKEFEEKRQKHINYVKTTKDDLRNHFANVGATDAYQVILYMSGHTERHVQQIKEIKINTDFPKN